MTTFEHHVQGLPAGTRVLMTAWRVSRSALRASASGELAPLRECLGTPGPDMRLAWTVRERQGVTRAVCELSDPTGAVRVLLRDEEATLTTDGTLLHASSPSLELSVDTSRDGLVLYARTAVLAALGLPGGCYEVDLAQGLC